MSEIPVLNETCAHCGIWDGHAADCPRLPANAARRGVVDELAPEINDAVGYDNRKELADLWQDFAPLPEQGLTEGTYDALLHVAKWGARRALENRRDVGACVCRPIAPVPGVHGGGIEPRPRCPQHGERS